MGKCIPLGRKIYPRWSPWRNLRRTAPCEGVPRACYIRGSFVTSEKVLGSIDSLTFLESYPISMKHPLNVAKQTQRCKSSLFIHGFLGFLGCVNIRESCVWHGQVSWYVDVSWAYVFKKNGEYKQIEAMCTCTASIHRIPITGYMKTP